MARCDQLAACSEEPDRLTRPFGSGAMRQAQELVGGWMEAAGLEVRRDNIGNLRGRVGPAEGPTLLIGSHLDSVRGAGKYDGPLGVVIAIAAAQRVRVPYALEVLAFADEEGLRYGTTYLGSRAVASAFDSAVLKHVDRAGIAMADASAPGRSKSPVSCDVYCMIDCAKMGTLGFPYPSSAATRLASVGLPGGSAAPPAPATVRKTPR